MKTILMIVAAAVLSGCIGDASNIDSVGSSEEEIVCGYNGCGVGGPKPKPSLTGDGEEQEPGEEKMPIVIPCAVGETPDGPNPCDPDPAPQGAGGSASE